MTKETENEMIGRRFGKLTVKELAGVSGGKKVWQCLCDCGNDCYVRTYDLVNHRKLTCGHCGSENGRCKLKALCRYAMQDESSDSRKICGYILITGTPRGCKASECNKFKPKGRGRR